MQELLKELENSLSKQMSQGKSLESLQSLKGIIYVENLNIHLPNIEFAKALQSMAHVAPLVASIHKISPDELTKQSKEKLVGKRKGRPRKIVETPENTQSAPVVKEDNSSKSNKLSKE